MFLNSPSEATRAEDYSHKELLVRIESLSAIVCELLEENQRLRLALTSARRLPVCPDASVLPPGSLGS